MIAKTLYDHYRQAVSETDPNGRPLPAFDQLPTNHQDAWNGAFDEAFKRVNEDAGQKIEALEKRLQKTTKSATGEDKSPTSSKNETTTSAQSGASDRNATNKSETATTGAAAKTSAAADKTKAGAAEAKTDKAGKAK